MAIYSNTTDGARYGKVDFVAEVNYDTDTEELDIVYINKDKKLEVYSVNLKESEVIGGYDDDSFIDTFNSVTGHSTVHRRMNTDEVWESFVEDNGLIDLAYEVREQWIFVEP